MRGGDYLGRAALLACASSLALGFAPSTALAAHSCSPGGRAPAFKGVALSGQARQQLRLTRVCITDSGFGAVVDATFAKDPQSLLAGGGTRATIGLLLEPAAAGEKPLVVATTGPAGRPADLHSKTLTGPQPVLRHGATLTFLVDYPHVDQLRGLRLFAALRGFARSKRASTSAALTPGSVLTPGEIHALDDALGNPGKFSEIEGYGSLLMPTLLDAFNCFELGNLIAYIERTAPKNLVPSAQARLNLWLSLAQADFEGRPCPPKTTTPPPPPPPPPPAAKSCTATVAASGTDVNSTLTCNFDSTQVKITPPSGKSVTNIGPFTCNDATCTPPEMCTFTSSAETCTGNRAAAVVMKTPTETTPSPASGDNITFSVTPADGTPAGIYVAKIP